MKEKAITNEITVDLDKSCCVWDNGKIGDPRIELWTNGTYVWAETNGDPVCDEVSLRDCLAEEGMDAATIERVLIGDLSTL